MTPTEIVETLIKGKDLMIKSDEPLIQFEDDNHIVYLFDMKTMWEQERIEDTEISRGKYKELWYVLDKI